MKVGNKVKIKPEFCDIGEEDYVYVIMKINENLIEIKDQDYLFSFAVDRILLRTF